MFNRIKNKLIAGQLLPILRNWKTTLIGAGLIVTQVQSVLADFGVLISQLVGVADTGTFDLTQFQISFTALASGIGLLFARDANKTSTETLAK